MSRKYVLGLDFGTESGRALLVATDNGEELATAVMNYPHGVIDHELPGTGKRLDPEWALQHPQDYLGVMEAVVKEAVAKSGVRGEDIVGIGVDFTACTMMPIDAANTPLCLKDEFKANPSAWVKLWKHHASQPEADRINEVAAARGETFLARYGGKVSSEWFFPKALQTLNEAPEVYAAADRFIEAGDWIVLQLTGIEKRNACAAGYKGMWDGSFPSKEFLRVLDPRFENIVAEKMRTDIVPTGTRVGNLLPEIAKRLGLRPDTAVAAAGIDAHVAVPGASVTGPGKMVMIMGTSLCHMVNSTSGAPIAGTSGVVRDGILPGYFGYEAGQSAVGDIFAWFVKSCVPGAITDLAKQQNTDVHGLLSCKAAGLKPGESGVLCLDWWNGNRSVLENADLSGLMVGMTLTTQPHELYRAVLESTAFGTYKIIETLDQGGCRVDELFACGGLSVNAPFLMQIFADVTNREIKVAASDQTVALGSAMWGAVAAGKSAGGHDSISAAAKSMARLRDKSYKPDPAAHAVYAKLYAEYERLHDHFGRGGHDVMKTLKALKRSARGKA